MRSIVGTVIIVQEERFQLLDRHGIGHQFLLRYDSSVEPDQLPSLLHRQVRVSYRPTEAAHIIGHTAMHIYLQEG
jgi:hypothetical protein